jgi:hypothetical protein
MTPVFEMMMIILQRIFIESGGQEHPQMLIVAAYPKHHVTCSWAVASANRLSNLQKPRCLLTTRPRVLACQVRHQENETERSRLSGYRREGGKQQCCNAPGKAFASKIRPFYGRHFVGSPESRWPSSLPGDLNMTS